MILIEGNNDYLNRQVRKELRFRHDRLAFHVEDEFEMTLKRLLKLLHHDNRYQVRENVVGRMQNLLNPADAHMIASGLLATGSFVLVCHDPLDVSTEQAQATFYRSTLEGLLPGMNIYHAEMVPEIVEASMKLWEENLETLKAVYETDIWSAGGLMPGMVMLVGDRVLPYVPCDEERRLAFVSHRGCSRFLHEALAANYELDGTRYYLTNAHKCDVAKLNLKMLQEEIDLVKPVKIVAMGGDAARYLSDLKATFDRTYHPQFWKRFRNKELPELIQLLSGHPLGL